VNAPVSPAVLLDAIKRERQRRDARASLYSFVQQAWSVVEPSTTFIASWHIEAICEHLEAITRGELRKLLINIPPRHALRLGTLVPTTRGMVRVEDLIVGDHVFGPDGVPVAILGKSDVFRDRPLFRVWTDDGAYVDVDGDHIWTVRLDRKYKRFSDYTTEELWHRQNGAFLRKKRNGETELDFSRRVKQVRLPRLPEVAPAQHGQKDLPIDPYVLGVWLGDGTSASSSFTMSDADASEVCAEIARRGYEVTKTNTQYRYTIRGLRTELRKLNLINNKHIPEEYLVASASQRRDLLKGLMDTDGNVAIEGQCFFAQSDLALINQVLRLLRSLGIKANLIETRATLNGKDLGPTWKVSFYAKEVACLARKETRTYCSKLRFGRYIKIEKLDETDSTQCISVDRADGLFLAGDGYIVTHNSKSTIVSVMWPMWEWLYEPSHKYLCASYSGTLSIRDNLKARRLVQSPWYQERWSEVFALAGDQNAKQRFENDKTGYRIATSVGGTATGEGGSRLILDDPHSAQDAQSDVMRDAAIEWFDVVWSTRLNNPKKDAMVTVMQRLHERDVSGHILEDIGGWEHICIPAEWDGKPRKTILGSYDPRQKVGELICPARFGSKEVEDLKKLLGAYGAAGQLQQEPSPAEGGILKTKYFRLWPKDKPLPQFEYVLQSYDTAFTEKTSGDPTGCEVWGIFRLDGQRQAMLLDAWDEHLSYPDLRERVIRDWNTEYGGTTGAQKGQVTKAVRPSRILVEAKASGQSLLQDLRLARVPAVGYNPGNADKVSRAHQAAPTLELGILWLPESAKLPGQAVSWAGRFLKQLERFPVAEHDEFVDCFTQAVIYLKNDGWFELPQARDRDEPRRRSPQSERANPYAV